MMKKISITANGEIHRVDVGKTFAEFLEDFGLKPERCLVELNGEILKFADFKDRTLSDGDMLEIMSIVAGG